MIIMIMIIKTAIPPSRQTEKLYDLYKYGSTVIVYNHIILYSVEKAKCLSLGVGSYEVLAASI